jgi:hypothetical protein
MIRLCLFLLCWLATSGVNAQERRMALVVGIDSYRYNDQLHNAVADAELMAKALGQAGFTVISKQNIDRTEFEKALAAFEKEVRPTDIALIYFSGHAIQAGNKNTLLASDSDIDAGIPFRKLVDATASAKFRILILDACRSNSATSKSVVLSGLKPEYPQGDTAVIFSAEAGTEASDGTETNGPFAASLARHLGDGLELVPMMRLVTGDVRSATSERQSPEIRVGGAAAFYFGASFSIQPGLGEPARLIARELEVQFRRGGFVLDAERPTIIYDVEVESRTVGRSLDGPDEVVVKITKRWTDPTLKVSAQPVQAEYAWGNPNSSAQTAAEQLYSLLLPLVRGRTKP